MKKTLRNVKLKKFDDYLKTRLTKQEIIEIERMAKLEARALKTLQQDVARIMQGYMKEEKIGFNELVRRLDVSPTHVAKIQKGDVNLTLASVARLFALLGREPHLTSEVKTVTARAGKK